MGCGLARGELRAFAAIGHDELSVGDLARRLEVSQGLASITAASLVRKGLFSAKDDGKRKMLSRALTISSVHLAALMAANPHVKMEPILSNSSLRVLAGFSPSPLSIRLAAQSTFTPEITVRRVVSGLMERAVMQKNGRTSYEIRLPMLKQFVDAWLLQELEMKRRAEMPGSLIARGPHGLLRSRKRDAPTWMVPTGLSAFGNYGVGLTLDFQDYYFHAFVNTPIRLDLGKHLVHSLLRSTLNPSGREVSYALLVVCKNRRKFREKEFVQYGKSLGVENEVTRCIELVDAYLKGKQWPEPMFKNPPRDKGPIWPSWEEFDELVKQYE